MKFFNVMPLELFRRLLQVMCLALKIPPIMNCEEGSRKVNLCRILGSIGLRGGM